MQIWTGKHLKWIKEQVRFEQPAQEATLLDYLHEVEHAAERIQWPRVNYVAGSGRSGAQYLRFIQEGFFAWRCSPAGS